MKVTALKAQVKNPERVSVFIDGAYSFSLNHAQLLEQKLRVGLELDALRLAELKQASDFGKAYERALNFVTIRPRSELELHQYGRRKQWAPETTQAVVAKLKTRRYVDDARFAHAWVEGRRLTKATSARKLQLELKQKGVADVIIREVLADSAHTDSDALQRLIAKKRKLSRYQNDPQKLMQYLARQGFGFDDIKAALS